MQVIQNGPLPLLVRPTTRSLQSFVLFAFGCFACCCLGPASYCQGQIRIERGRINELQRPRVIGSAKENKPVSVDPVFKELDNKPLIAWNNGNVLPGKLTKGTDSKLFWDSELFRGELPINFAAVNNVRFPRDDSKRSTEEKYYVHTTSGDKLFGNISRIADGDLVLNSDRHGELTIALDSVSRIVDLENSGYVMMGVSDLDDWTSLDKTKDGWKVTDSGELVSTKANVGIQREIELPDALQIELVVNWEKNLDLVFGLGVPTSTQVISRLPRIETWQDAIVLNHQDDFAIIYDSLGEDTRRLALQIQWNRKTNVVVVRDESGKELCQTEIPAKLPGINNGLYLENKKGDLQIETLRISKTSAGFNPSKLGVQTTMGSAVYGELVEFDGKSWTLWTLTSDAETESNEDQKEIVAGDKFRSAILSFKSEAQPSSNNVLIRYQDGSLLNGKLLGIADDKLSLETKFSSQPVSASFTGLAVIRFSTDPEIVDQMKLAGKHRLMTEYGALLGQVLSGDGDPSDVIRWQPVGCDVGLPLANADSKIVLVENPKKEVEEEVLDWPDTIYFKNKDTIACRVISIDDQEVVFESFAEKGHVPHSLIKAIDFSQAEGTDLVSFEEAGWQFSDRKDSNDNEEPEKPDAAKEEQVNPKVEITGPNELVIRRVGTFGHTSLSTVGSLKFNLEWKSDIYNTLKVRQFLRSPRETGGGIGASFLLRNRSITLTTLDQTRGSDQNRLNAPDNKAEIEIVFDGKSLAVNVEGRQAYYQRISTRLMRGSAISFELTSINSDPTQVTIKDLTTDMLGSNATPVFIEPEKLELLMTIPRLRKDDPPKHILCARNRDFLRGELTGMDKDEIKFKSLYDNFAFDRNVVSSIVWLHAKTPEQLEKEAAEAEKVENGGQADPVEELDQTNQVVQVILRGGKRVTINAGEWSDETFKGVSDTLGNCSVPVEDILELRLGKFATEATDVAYAKWVAKPARAPIIGDPGSDTEFGKKSPLVGTQAKNFSLKLLDGSQFELSENRGKVIVLDFWATWCGPCIRAMPSMIEATDLFDPDKVVFIAVNELEHADLIKDYMLGKQWEMTVGLDNGDIGDLFQVESIPHTVIIDQKGKIAFLSVGATNDLKNKMTRAIGEIAGPEAVRK